MLSEEVDVLATWFAATPEGFWITPAGVAFIAESLRGVADRTRLLEQAAVPAQARAVPSGANVASFVEERARRAGAPS